MLFVAFRIMILKNPFVLSPPLFSSGPLLPHGGREPLQGLDPLQPLLLRGLRRQGRTHRRLLAQGELAHWAAHSILSPRLVFKVGVCDPLSLVSLPCAYVWVRQGRMHRRLLAQGEWARTLPHN